MANRFEGSYRVHYPTRLKRDNGTKMPRGVARDMKALKRAEAIDRQIVNVKRGYSMPRVYTGDYKRSPAASLDQF